MELWKGDLIQKSLQKIFDKIKQTELNISEGKFDEEPKQKDLEFITAKLKDLEWRGLAGNLEYKDLIETNLCNIDTLLDTWTELENMWKKLIEEERQLKA